jgi:HEPN domain-containing protein
MQKDKNISGVVREWVQKAENDITAAANTLKMGDDGPMDTVCFHVQQCAEKYIKALLVWKGIPFPKTHNLSLLVTLLPPETPVLLFPEEQELLTDYAVVTRYPGDTEEPSFSEAAKAVKLARRVRKDIRAMLPKEALPPTRRKKRKRS